MTSDTSFLQLFELGTRNFEPSVPPQRGKLSALGSLLKALLSRLRAHYSLLLCVCAQCRLLIQTLAIYYWYMQNVSLPVLLESLPVEIILWVIFGGMLLIFGSFSAVLLWHWKIYSTGRFTTVSNMVLYLTVSAGFLTIMIISIFWYSL